MMQTIKHKVLTGKTAYSKKPKDLMKFGASVHHDDIERCVQTLSDTYSDFEIEVRATTVLNVEDVERYLVAFNERRMARTAVDGLDNQVNSYLL